MPLSNFSTPSPIAVALDLYVADVRFAVSDRADTIVEVRPSDPSKAADSAVTGPVEVRLPVAEGDDAAMVRINLRLPANLKALIEDAAAGGGLSVNTWIVRAAAAGLANEGRRATRPAPTLKTERVVGERYTGWAR